MPRIKRFYQWSPRWRHKPQTHEVMVEIDNGGGSVTCVPIATCPSKGWALKIEQALNALLKVEQG